MALVIKNPSANAGGIRDVGSIPGLGKSPGGGQGNPLQYSCLENPKHLGSWQAIVHRVTKNGTLQKRLSTHACDWLLIQGNFLLKHKISRVN